MVIVSFCIMKTLSALGLKMYRAATVFEMWITSLLELLVAAF